MAGIQFGGFEPGGSGGCGCCDVSCRICGCDVFPGATLTVTEVNLGTATLTWDGTGAWVGYSTFSFPGVTIPIILAPPIVCPAATVPLTWTFFPLTCTLDVSWPLGASSSSGVCPSTEAGGTFSAHFSYRPAPTSDGCSRIVTCSPFSIHWACSAIASVAYGLLVPAGSPHPDAVLTASEGESPVDWDCHGECITRVCLKRCQGREGGQESRPYTCGDATVTLFDPAQQPIPGGSADVGEDGCVTLTTTVSAPKYIIVSFPEGSRYKTSTTEIFPFENCTRQRTVYVNVTVKDDYICCNGVSIPKHMMLTDSNGTWDFIYNGTVGRWLALYDVSVPNGMPVIPGPPTLCGIHCPGTAPTTVGYIGSCLPDGTFFIAQGWDEWFAFAGYECFPGVYAYGPSRFNCGGWVSPPFDRHQADGSAAIDDAACDDFALTVPLTVDLDFGTPHLAPPGGLSIALS